MNWVCLENAPKGLDLKVLLESDSDFPAQDKSERDFPVQFQKHFVMQPPKEPFHPGLSKIPAPAGGPGSDIIKLGITIGGQKLSAGRFLICGAGWGLTFCLPKFASTFLHIQRKQV